MNGLDANAYGKAEGIIVDLTLSSCYDYVEQSCEFVLKHLSVLQKLSECPRECREAISSLMIAAARFSDLSELRERYGNSIECYVNQEFAANLNLKSAALEKKVLLMQDIASEFSIKWDSKAFELRMPKSSAFAQDKKVEKIEGGSNLHDSWGNATPLRASQDTATAMKSPGHAGFHSKNNLNEPFSVNNGDLLDAGNITERKVEKDDTPRLKPPYYNNAIPPPYVKSNSKLKICTRETDLSSSHIDSEDIILYPSVHGKPYAASTSERIRLGLDKKDSGHERPSKEGHEKELSTHDAAAEIPVLTQKSMRRRHSKSQSSDNDASNNDAEVERKPRSRRRDETRHSLQIMFDDKQHETDEDERVIDRLLIHYSNKPPIPVPEKARRSKSRHAHWTRESLRMKTMMGLISHRIHDQLPFHNQEQCK